MYEKSREMHKRLNLDYLVKNGFIEEAEEEDHMETKFKVGETSSGKKYAFIGQCDSDDRPAGFVRCVDE